MSLISSLFAGVSGLRTNSQAMNVIGDNISNTNTVGFKSNKTVFGDLFSTILQNGSTTSQLGKGTQFIGTLQDFSQGSIETTTNSLDMAVDGQGFFIVNNGQGNFYSRAGQFRINDNGIVQDITGNTLQGFQITNGVVGAALTDVDLAGVQSAPSQSTTFTLGANLDASAPVNTAPGVPPGSQFSSPITLVNSIGDSFIATITFSKLADWTALGTSGTGWSFATTISTTGATVTGGTGTLFFDQNGVLTDTLGAAATAPTALNTVDDLTITMDFTGATPPAASMPVVWELTDDATGTGASNGRMTGFAIPSNNNSVVQDGFQSGILTGLSVATDGTINGLFSNGQSEGLFQVALADFLAPTGLTRAGQNLFAESGLSGQPVIAAPQTGAFGSVLGSSLELANVDLAQEFVTMIKTQQAFQASARIITTTDDLLTETVNLTR